MKKIIKLFVLLLLGFKTNAQSPPFYYYNGQKIELKESEDKLLIRIADPANQENINSLEAKIKQDNNYSIVAPDMDHFGGEYYLLSKNTGSLISKTDEINYYINESYVSSVSFGLIAADNTLEAVSNEVLAKLKGTPDINAIKSIASPFGLVSGFVDQFDPTLFHLFFPKQFSMNTLQIANALYETGNFEYAEPNFYMRLRKHCADTDPYFPWQWGLYDDGLHWSHGMGADINVCTAWNFTKGSNEIFVADIDEGVDLSHPDLVMSIPALGGFDATTGSSPGACVGDDAHGTATSGIMVANNNTIGVVGVAPNCGLWPVRIFSSGSTTTSWIVSGINWSWSTGAADVLSNSWGGGSPDASIDAAILNAVTSGRGGLGCTVVFSSGNDNASAIAYPSSNPNVISVGAMSMCNERKSPSSCDGEAWGGNYGTGLGVVAPGVKVSTTDIHGPAGFSHVSPNPWLFDFPGDNSYVETFDGTSASCPFVSGVALLILSVNPCLKWNEVRDLIEITADRVGSYTYTSGFPNGTWNNEMGYGRVDAGNAVTLANDMYKQDKTETSAIVYSGSHKTFAGYDVTSLLPLGDYIVNPSANITFKSPEEINLMPGFIAQNGSVFLGEIVPFYTCTASESHYRTSNPGITENNVQPFTGNDVITDVKIYPNPTHDILNVTYALTQSASTVSIDIINALGQKVQENSFTGGQVGTQFQSLNVSSFVPGNYFIYIKIGDENHQFKFVKE